jgi:tetratricopeptide (TPR) repeat protein
MKHSCLILLMLWTTAAIGAERSCPESGFDGALCRGHSLSAQNKPTEALSAYAEAEKLATEPFATMLAITFQARAYRSASNIEKALSLYQMGFEAAELANSAQGKWINLNEKSELLLARNEAKQALAGFLQGYTFAANANERAESDRLIASAYKQLGDYDRAIEYQLKTSLLEQSNGDLHRYLQAILELASLRTTAKSYAQAQRNLDEAMKQSKAASSDYWQAKTLLYQARLEKVMNRANQAQALLQQAAALSNKVGDTDLSNDIAAEQR